MPKTIEMTWEEFKKLDPKRFEFVGITPPTQKQILEAKARIAKIREERKKAQSQK